MRRQYSNTCRALFRLLVWQCISFFLFFFSVPFGSRVQIECRMENREDDCSTIDLLLDCIAFVRIIKRVALNWWLQHENVFTTICFLSLLIIFFFSLFFFLRLFLFAYSTCTLLSFQLNVARTQSKQTVLILRRTKKNSDKKLRTRKEWNSETDVEEREDRGKKNKV